MLQNNYYLLRHGRTSYQEEKEGYIYPQDCTDKVSLSKVGKRQVKLKAKLINELDLDEIYSSDFLRTRETAEIVKKEIDFKENINFTKELRDINLGIWHGKKKKNFYKKFGKDNFEKTPKNGESLIDTQDRMWKFLLKIDKKTEDKNILIISHRDPLWLLEGKLKGRNVDELVQTKKNKNFFRTAELIKLN